MTKITHRLHRVLSGTPLAMGFQAAGSFNCSLTSIGSGKYAIPLKGTRYSPATWQSATQHWFSMIGEYWDDVPVYYGLIADKFFDFATEVLTLDTVTVDDLFENRYTFGVGTYEAGDLSITSQSLRAALIQVLKRGTGWGGNWGLPFNYRTPQVEGGPFSQTWRYHDWKRISDLRRLIQSMDDGPDLAFIPRADASFNASWDVYAGNPRIDGPTIDLPLSVAKPNAQKVVLGERGRGMQSGAFVRGEGGGAVRATGAGRPIGQAGFIGGPTMAVRDAARDMVANDANLDSIALGDLKKNRKPIEQWDLELILGREKNPLPIADFRLGSRLNLRHSGNAYREAETVTQYVVAFSHNTSEPLIVKPEVQTL